MPAQHGLGENDALLSKDVPSSHISESRQCLLDSLSTMESKLDVLIGWQHKIFSALSSKGSSNPKEVTIDFTEELVKLEEDVDKSSSGHSDRPPEVHIGATMSCLSSLPPEIDAPSSVDLRKSFAVAPQQSFVAASSRRLQLRQFVTNSSVGSGSIKVIAGQMAMPIFTASIKSEGGGRTWHKNWLIQFSHIFPLLPNSRIAGVIEMVSVIFLLYESIMVPYMLAWGAKMEGYFLWISWITALFWTMDLFLHFAKAYTHGNEVVREYRKIACNYMKRRFSLDLFVVAFDWLGIASGMVSLMFVKFVRVLKVSRLFRLNTSRAMGIKEYFIRRAESVGLDVQAVVLVNLLPAVILILWLNHIGSCAWIALETSSFADQKDTITWQHTIAAMHGGTSFDDAGLSGVFLYSISYYWALSAMISGESFLEPKTATESIFASLYVLFGFLIASSMISAMASNLMAGHHANQEKKRKLHQLHEYLLQRDIDPLLGSMITIQLRQRLNFQRRIVESDVPLLATLSADLREKLRIQLWTPAFTLQPLWRTCVYLDNQIINNVIRNATEAFNPEPGEILFIADSPMEQMFFLLHGTMQYTFHPVGNKDADREFMCSRDVAKVSTIWKKRDRNTRSLASHDETSQKTTVRPIKQICEIALWVEWSTVGLMEAVEHTELLVIPVTDFVNVVEASSVRVSGVLRAYAIALVGCIETENADRVTDLALVDHDAIVPLMSQEPRMSMSMPAFTALQLGGHLGNQSSQLHDEVRLGKCNLGQDESGVIRRVVKLVVMQLERADGRICVSLGEIGNEGAKVNINLPGVKQRPMENLRVCKDHILEKCFASEVPEVSVDKVENDAELKPSAAYGVATKYIRTTCHAHILSYDFWDNVDTHTLCRQEFEWVHGTVECFTKGLPVGSEYPQEEVDLRVFAWMRENEFDILKEMGSDAEDTVVGWMQKLNALRFEKKRLYI